MVFTTSYIQVETKRVKQNGELETINETFVVSPEDMEENVPLKILKKGCQCTTGPCKGTNFFFFLFFFFLFLFLYFIFLYFYFFCFFF